MRYAAAKPRKPFALLFGLAIALGVGLTVWLIAQGIGAIRANSFLTRTVRPLELRDPTTADEEFIAQLQEATKYARRQSEWMRLLRVGWSVPEQWRYEVTETIAARALQRHPRDEFFAAVAAYGALKRSSRERASIYVRDRTRELELTQLVEFLSHERLAEKQPLATDTAARAFLDLVQVGDADSYRAAFERTGSAALALDGALVALSEGKRAVARGLAESIIAHGAEARFGALLVHRYLDDDRRFSEVLSRMEPQEAVDPRVLLLQADRLIATRQWSRAEPVYAELRAVHPRMSAVPWINGAYFAATRNDSADERALLNAAQDLVGNDVMTQLAVRSFVARTGDHSSIRYSAAAPSTVADAAAAFLPGSRLRTLMHDYWLIRHLEGPNRANLARFEAELWSYTNRYPDAQRVAGLLARHLYRRGDNQGLQVMLGRSPREQHWTIPFRAAIAARRGDLSTAERELMRAIRERGAVLDHYNIVLFALRHLPQPVVVERAVELRRTVLRHAVPDDTRVELLLAEAEVERIGNDVVAARAAAERALTIAPGNPRVRAYLSLIAP